jgi:hypothetical protein
VKEPKTYTGEEALEMVKRFDRAASEQMYGRDSKAKETRFIAYDWADAMVAERKRRYGA